jgi:hypothetical protein
MLRRGPNAEYAVTPLGIVEVELQDSLFGKGFFQPPGKNGFFCLADGVLGRREIEVLGELLAYGGTSGFEPPSPDILLQGDLHGLEIEPAVVPELIVFGDDDRLHQVRRNFRQRYP